MGEDYTTIGVKPRTKERFLDYLKKRESCDRGLNRLLDENGGKNVDNC